MSKPRYRYLVEQSCGDDTWEVWDSFASVKDALSEARAAARSTGYDQQVVRVVVDATWPARVVKGGE